MIQWSRVKGCKLCNFLYWSIKQRSILRASSIVSGHDGFWMHPMLTLPVKETALKLIIKVLGSRVYKIENSFLKGTGTNWMGDNIKEFSNWWQNWSRISSHQVEGSWEKTIIFNLSLVRLDFRQARISGKETVLLKLCPKEKYNYCKTLHASWKPSKKHANLYKSCIVNKRMYFRQNILIHFQICGERCLRIPWHLSPGLIVRLVLDKDPFGSKVLVIWNKTLIQK